jgi:cobalt-zinc-cadmium efflux system membrane fusion protein
VHANVKQEAPPAANVVELNTAGLFTVDHPEQFPLATASAYVAAPELDTTGTVNVDISRNVPVISLATGRVVEIDARLGDTVHKGQRLLRIQSNDIAQAFSAYRQAVADDVLAKAQLDRSQLLFDKGAVAQKDLEVAKDTEAKAQVSVETALELLRTLGADPSHPEPFLDILAPVSGVITDQNVTTAAGVQSLGGPNPFTISDLSHVWIMCDVYENNLSFVRLGEFSNIHLDAYPDLVLKGRIGNIGPILDPSLRTAKVRLEVANPGVLRLGMFVRATFFGQKKVASAVVPADAVLHLHDRDWVYVPAGGKQFRRIEVVGGKMLPGNNQTIASGIKPGDRVVANALDLQATAEQ